MIIMYYTAFGHGSIFVDVKESTVDIRWCSECVWIVPGTEIDE